MKLDLTLQELRHIERFLPTSWIVEKGEGAVYTNTIKKVSKAINQAEREIANAAVYEEYCPHCRTFMKYILSTDSRMECFNCGHIAPPPKGIYERYAAIQKAKGNRLYGGRK